MSLNNWNYDIKIKNYEHVNELLNYDDSLDNLVREKTGSYYTPEYISEYMIKSSIVKYIKNRFSEASNDFTHIMEKYKKYIIQIKIIDLSCGTGVFLRSYFKILVENYILDDIEKGIVSENIFGIDIQSEPLEIIKRYFEEKYDVKLKHIYNIDTLNSFDFKMVIKDMKFDLVIGNPPYLGEKGNKEIFDKVKMDKICKSYYEGKMDLFYFFLYRGYELLDENSVLTYITTNYFVTADGAKKLRLFMKSNLDFYQIINFNNIKLFKAAIGQHNMIYSFGKKKKKSPKCDIIQLNEFLLDSNKLEGIFNEYKLIEDIVNKSGVSYYEINQDEIYGENNNIYLYQKYEYKKIVEKIIDNSNGIVSDYYEVNQGIVSGADYITKNIFEKKLENRKGHNIGDGIFVISDEELEKFTENDCKYIKKFYKNSDILRYVVKEDSNKNIIYSDNSFDVENQDNIISHLNPFKEILEKRREVKKGSRKWYHLQWYRDKSIFEKEKVVCPQRSRVNKFGYNDTEWYGSADIYYISNKDSKESLYDLKTLCYLLNSKLYYFWLYNRGKRKGHDLELYSTPLKEIPLIDIEKRQIEVIKNILSKSNFLEICSDIDNILYEEIGLNDKEIREIELLYSKGVGQK